MQRQSSISLSGQGYKGGRSHAQRKRRKKSGVIHFSVPRFGRWADRSTGSARGRREQNGGKTRLEGKRRRSTAKEGSRRGSPAASDPPTSGRPLHAQLHRFDWTRIPASCLALPPAPGGMASTSERVAALLPRDPQSQKALYWSLAAATACAAGTAVWWLTRESYYSYVPIQVGGVGMWWRRYVSLHGNWELGGMLPLPLHPPPPPRLGRRPRRRSVPPCAVPVPPRDLHRLGGADAGQARQAQAECVRRCTQGAALRSGRPLPLPACRLAGPSQTPRLPALTNPHPRSHLPPPPPSFLPRRPFPSPPFPSPPAPRPRPQAAARSASTWTAASTSCTTATQTRCARYC